MPASPSPPISQPRLGLVGYARFAWRQLTSMSTALLLLLLLALASVPGSLIPQRSSDPNGVIQFRDANPDLVPLVDFLQLHTVYGSVWFSAIYLLLFVSLVGCVIPRSKHHLDALRKPPPKPPTRFARLPAHMIVRVPDTGEALDELQRRLRSRGYRVVRQETSISAERGYLRETGNLVFHISLIGVLVTFGVLTGFGYMGQKIIVEGQTFGNVVGAYDSFTPERFFTPESMEPFTLRLDSFEADYEFDPATRSFQPLDYRAVMTTDEGTQEVLRVNEPLSIGRSQVYLLGNGFAPVVTVRDGNGEVAFSGAVPFLATDSNLTSMGVIKVPDAQPEQLGLLGFFYPTAAPLETGAFTSVSPEPALPLLTLNVFTGDLGLDDGISQSVYSLNTDELEKRTGTGTDADTLFLAPGETVALPDGLGSITFDELRRFVGVDIAYDPTPLPMLVFSTLTLGGLLLGMFIPRRRIWARQLPDESGLIELAALARGDDPALPSVLSRLADAVGAAAEEPVG